MNTHLGYWVPSLITVWGDTRHRPRAEVIRSVVSVSDHTLVFSYTLFDCKLESQYARSQETDQYHGPDPLPLPGNFGPRCVESL